MRAACNICLPKVNYSGNDTLMTHALWANVRSLKKTHPAQLISKELSKHRQNYTPASKFEENRQICGNFDS